MRYKSIAKYCNEYYNVYQLIRLVERNKQVFWSFDFRTCHDAP